MKRPLKVLALVHPQMRPDRKGGGATENDVWAALKRLGHVREVCAIQDGVEDFDRQLRRFKPDIVFNLLEEFRDEGVFDFHLVTRLEAMGIPYTGCNPRGLIVSRNKVWANHVACGSGVATPRFFADQSKVEFPAFVKYTREHASRGLTARNRVRTLTELKRVRHQMDAQFGGELLVQEFIAGMDVTVPVIGNGRPQVLHPWVLHLGGPQGFATERLKFSAKWRRRSRVTAKRFKGKEAAAIRLAAKKLYAAFDLSGYARVDFRLDKDGRFYFIDINANPNLARDEDFAAAARLGGLNYLDLIQRVLELGRNYRPKI